MILTYFTKLTYLTLSRCVFKSIYSRELLQSRTGVAYWFSPLHRELKVPGSIPQSKKGLIPTTKKNSFLDIFLFLPHTYFHSQVRISRKKFELFFPSVGRREEEWREGVGSDGPRAWPCIRVPDQIRCRGHFAGTCFNIRPPSPLSACEQAISETPGGCRAL